MRSQGPAPTGHPRSGRLAAAGFDPPGAVLVGLGASLIIVAFTVLRWFRDLPGPFGVPAGHSTFAGVHQLIVVNKRQVDQLRISRYVTFGVAEPYFSWLGWVLLVAALWTGALAVSRLGATVWGLRWLGAVVAVTGLALTLLSVQLINVEGAPPQRPPSYGSYLAHGSFGLWAACGGFLLILIGCLLPRRDRWDGI